MPTDQTQTQNDDEGQNLYDAYTGKYLLSLPYNKPKVVTISKKDDRLWGKMEGLPQSELLPLSENAFHAKNADIKLFFIKDEKGNISGDRFVGDRWWFQQIAFMRDGMGHITGFRLSAEDGLVRNLLFQKQY